MSPSSLYISRSLARLVPVTTTLAHCHINFTNADKGTGWPNNTELGYAASLSCTYVYANNVHAQHVEGMQQLCHLRWADTSCNLGWLLCKCRSTIGMKAQQIDVLSMHFYKAV